MPAPIALLALLGLGAALAMGGASKGAAPSTKPLDPGIPPAVDQQVKTMLATVTDPNILRQTATAMDMAGYKNASAALRARAAQLEGQIQVPGVRPPMPAPGALPSIPGAPPIPPPPTPPGPSIEDLDPGIPPALASAVAALLAKPDLTDQELAFTDQLATTCEQAGFPRAAAKLRARAIAVRAQHAGSGLLTQISNILTTPPNALPPLPTSSLPGVPAIPGGPAPTPTPVVTAPSPPTAAPLAKTYKVVRGDSPATIAQRFTGNQQNFRQLAAANPDKSARILAGNIFEGETLTLPDSWPATPSAAAPRPVAPVAVTPAPLGASHAMIRQGSSGADVALWQQIIHVTADGQFGPQTDAATRTWQAQHGLTADGIVGPQTWGVALGTAPVPSAPTVAPVFTPAVSVTPTTTHAMIRQGSTGPDVVAWQRIIGVTADGQFGPATAAATRLWQTQHGLTADGVVGPMTWAAAAQSSTAGHGGYRVQPGDTPFSLAQRFTRNGNRFLELAEANPLAAARIRNGILQEGEVLTLPIGWRFVAAAGPLSPAAIAGVLDIIGGNRGRFSNGNYRGA